MLPVLESFPAIARSPSTVRRYGTSLLARQGERPDAKGFQSRRASFLRLDGTVWTTDKDGLLLDSLVAEITAATGKDPGEHFQEMVSEFGMPHYTRVDAAASPEQKAKLLNLSASDVRESCLAGDPIVNKLTKAPGNGERIGGLKIAAKRGWFAARPSGIENIYKIYAESFESKAHLDSIVMEAPQIVNRALHGTPNCPRQTGWQHRQSARLVD
jgi:phosphoglucomutase